MTRSTRALFAAVVWLEDSRDSAGRRRHHLI